MTKQRNTRVQPATAISLKRIQMSKGIFSRVARDLNVSVTAVTLVAHGKRKSKRISAALEQELARIDAAVKGIKRKRAA